MAVDLNELKRLVNPLALSLKKMELEVKCPFCLDFMRSPTMLPCSHIFCSCCVTGSVGGRSCPACGFSFDSKDLRSVDILGTIISIFKSMISPLLASMLQRGSHLDPCGALAGEVNKSSDALDHKIVCNGSNDGQVLSKKINFTADANGGRGSLKKGEICSPCSVDEFKNSDIDSTQEQVSEHVAEKYTGNCSSISDVEAENNQIQGVAPKKQKLDNNVHSKDFKCDTKPREFSIPDPTSECVFCHSCGITLASGPMLHYVNGNPISDTQPLPSEALHVHQNCIEWAPQVFFVGESAMNLEVEIARAAKIKCSSCGLKGAALGCYVKSCKKSFHVPCALEIPGSRWDSDKFVMLCTAHSSNKLPGERGKGRKKVETRNASLERQAVSVSSSVDTKFVADNSLEKAVNGSWISSPIGTSEWVITGSGLNGHEKELLHGFGEMSGALVLKGWKGRITHVIASTDESGACTRTLKVLKAILEGKWVVRIGWIKACLSAGCAVPEEHFEITHDVCGSFGGPKRGRLRKMNREPKLFTGLRFYFSGKYLPSYKGDLEDLLTSGGGSILNPYDISSIEESGERGTNSKNFVVYFSELSQSEASNGSSLDCVLKKRVEEAEMLAAKIDFQAVKHTWILDSVSACDLQPI